MWLLWSDRQGTREPTPKEPPKPSGTVRLEASADGRWLEVFENSVVVEVYIWGGSTALGADGAAKRTAPRTRT